MQALWMVLGAFFFATMGVAVKYASASFSTFELVFYRGIISVVFLGLVLRNRGI
jgi:S-adenosylmethionine uptake transporter